MREIKFRAWSDFYEKYADFDAELYMDGSVEADFTDGTGIPHHETTDLVVEQYTGLKDKNGKEIYEGDIVKKTWFNGDDGDITIIGVVGFNEEEASFGIVQTIQRTYEQYSGFYSQREVIGNIHENPELLDVKKEG